MATKRLFSIHPKLAAVIDAVFYIAILWWVLNFQNAWMLLAWVLLRIVWWTVLVQTAYYPPFINRYHHLVSLVIFDLGILPYLVFVDNSLFNYVQIFAAFIPAYSFWLIPAREDSLSVMVKPHRRWNFFMSLFGISGVWLFVEAGSSFQIFYGWQTVFYTALACIITAAISFWEWRDYGILFDKSSITLLSILFLIILELGSIVYLWPVGYFVSSFFIAWIWYIVWLMFRFQLTKEGIDWKKQHGFLIVNFLLLILFLTRIVRWK